MTGKLISVQVFTLCETYKPSPGTTSVRVDISRLGQTVVREYRATNTPIKPALASLTTVAELPRFSGLGSAKRED